ncbi:MAG: segregation/condensation protein A, partial [Myxococcales bacterium]|nr:segregation/condensation protein A [Myxococcales bacterium]
VATARRTAAPADEGSEVLELLGSDVRAPVAIPKDYKPSDSVREPLFRVEISDFAGPLDLLLYLIRRHHLDILDIPIRFITQRYLEMLEDLRALKIDVASEFLVLAAELTHIKSKMLLPSHEGVVVEEPEDEDSDPRAELVMRLLEYQKYRDAATQLDDRDLLGRDVFARVPPSQEAVDLDPGLKSINIFRLVELMSRLLRQAPPRSHEISFETYSIRERIDHVVAFARERDRKFTLGQLLETVQTRAELVVTFIAVLEMTKLGLLRLMVEEIHEAALLDEELPLPTIWAQLTRDEVDGELIDDYRG